MRFPGFTEEWEKIKLSDCCTFYSGGTPLSGKSEYYGGNIPFIRSGEIHSNKTELFITEDGFKASSAKMVSKGDLLLAMYGATSGEIDISKIDGAINQAILCINTSQNKYFFKSVWSKHVAKILNTYLQGGQGNLSAEIIRGIKFAFPTLSEQEKISKLIIAIDERIAVQNKINEDLKKLKSAIRWKIFSDLKNHHTKAIEVGELLAYEQPSFYIVTSNEYVSDSNKIPVLTANKGFILGYTDEPFGIYQKGDCIIFDDFTMDAKYVTFPF